MKNDFHKFSSIKPCLIINLLLIISLILVTYQSSPCNIIILGKSSSKSNNVIERQVKHVNRTYDERLTFERRTHCNYRQKDLCYSTNKSIVVTFWNKKSIEKWVAQNILSAFPLDSFDHMIFVHDNSSWHTHAGYKHFIWIHVDSQLRFWYIKRFLLPMISVSYEYLWILDDDIKLNFSPLHYQCVLRNLNIPLSSPGRLNGAWSHGITQINSNYTNKIGRWTDFIETGPIAVMSSLAWQCIYKYINASTGSGWGLDYIWCDIIAKECLPLSEREKACAILDVFTADHQSASTNSVSDGAPEIRLYTEPYKTWVTKQKNLAPLAQDNKLLEFCNR